MSNIVEDYTDKTPMPFGKFIGKPLANIEASYLIWLYETSENGKRLSNAKLAKYIQDNLSGLRIEAASEKQKKYFERR